MTTGNAGSSVAQVVPSQLLCREAEQERRAGEGVAVAHGRRPRAPVQFLLDELSRPRRRESPQVPAAPFDHLRPSERSAAASRPAAARTTHSRGRPPGRATYCRVCISRKQSYAAAGRRPGSPRSAITVALALPRSMSRTSTGCNPRTESIGVGGALHLEDVPADVAAALRQELLEVDSGRSACRGRSPSRRCAAASHADEIHTGSRQRRCAPAPNTSPALIGCCEHLRSSEASRRSAHRRRAHQTPARTTGARVVRGGLWKMLANALPQLYALVLSIAAARYLGLERDGPAELHRLRRGHNDHAALGSFSLALMRYVGEAVGAGRAGAARWLAGPHRAGSTSSPPLVGGGDARARRRASAGRRATRGYLAALAIVQRHRRDRPERHARRAAALARRDDRRPRPPGAGRRCDRRRAVARRPDHGACSRSKRCDDQVALLWTGAARPRRAGRAASGADPRARAAPGDGPLRRVLVRRHAALPDRLAPLGVLLPPALLERPRDRLLLDRLRDRDGRRAASLGDGRGAGPGRSRRFSAQGPTSASGPGSAARYGCSSSRRCP